MKPGRYRKWVVLAAVYLGIIIVSMTAYMGGVLYVELLDRYHDGKAKTSLVFSLNGGLLCFLGPVSAVVVNRFSCRVGLTAGGVLITIAGLASGLVDNVDWLIFTYGIVGGFGNSLAYVPGCVVLSYYFKKHRSFILALSCCLVGVGMLFASPVAALLIEQFSLPGTFLILGAINAHMCIIGILCKPSQFEIEIHNKKIKESLITKNNNNKNVVHLRKQPCNTRFSAQDLCFPLFLVSTLAWNVLFGIFTVHLPSYASNQGSSDAEISTMMGCLSIANIVGRLLGTAAVGVSNLNGLLIHGASVFTMASVCLTSPLYDSFDISKYIFAVSFGLLTGIPNALMTPNTITLVGVESMSNAIGWGFFFSGVGYMAGPPVVGALLEYSGSYRSGFAFAGGINILGGVLVVAAYWIHKRKAVTEDKDGMEITVKDGDKASSALLQ